jgi:uncharacterized protein YndB with AHSA1/START domain
MNNMNQQQIKKSIFIAAEPEEIFKAITTARDWNRYFTTGMELDPKPGGVCNFKWENRGPELVSHESPGRVIDVRPPSLFVFEWGSPGRETIARMEIEPLHDGSVLTLSESGYPDDEQGREYMVECAAHWGELLALIKFYVEFGVTYRSPAPGGGASS